MQRLQRELGPLPKNPKRGYIMIPVGVLIIIPGFIILEGLPMFAVLGTMCILSGIHTITQSHKRGCVCPCCDLNYDMLLDATDFVCPRCGKYSVREDERLVHETADEPIEEELPPQEPQAQEEAAEAAEDNA